jgi:germination protein M
VPRPRIQAGMRSRAFAVSVALAVLAAACGSEEEGPSAPAAKSTTPPTVESQPLATVPETAPAILKVYFLQDGKVAVESRSVVAGPAVGRAALVQLLKGPTPEEAARGLRSELPPGTQIESLELVPDCMAEVELSSDVDDSAKAQVIFTLTQFETVCEVSVNGDEPIKRVDLEEFTPPVLLESPVPGEDVTTPVRIEGTANTFEATFNVEIVDADGKVIGERFVTATSGSGTRGTFSVDVQFKAASQGPGELVVFELSAEDGSRIHEVRIPVQIRLPR